MLNKNNYTEKDLVQIIKNISVGVSSSSGDVFFEKLILHIYKLYGMSHIIIGTLNKKNNSIVSLKFMLNGELIDNIEYSLEYTPCADVIKYKSSAYKKDVQKLFSQDEFFKINNIQSYIGIRLIDSLSKGVGIIACLDTKELIYTDSMHSILEIFASRASAELDRINIENHLEERIKDRTSKLTKALDKLKQKSHDELIKAEKMAKLGSMVTGFTHDLNTPIGIGVTASSFIQAKCKSIKNDLDSGKLSKSALNSFIDDSYSMAESMFKSLEKAKELVRSFKIISIDQHVAEKKKIFLKSYLNDILISLNYILKHTNISIQNDIPISLEIIASAGIFFQIFSNLIMNSIKHGFDGIHEGKINISASYENKILYIIYKDNGKGMNEETKNKIFEQFYTTKKNDGGTGLGMFIVYELVVQKSHGTIDLISQPDMGVEFKIKLPL